MNHLTLKAPAYSSLAILIMGILGPLASVASEELSSDELKSMQLELKKLSLSQLLETEITSVSKKIQKISESAAAVFVISNEDIKRSAATTLPDVLRLATGLQVSQTNGHIWAISARGFNDIYSSKLLVLIDGRSVYMPEFSGVMWDAQDTILEDIERIEVIRGSGGTMWGANAVNGVINVITKNAKDTLGGLISAGAGNIDKAFGSVRYGMALNDNSYMRVYAKGTQQEPFKNGAISDAWWSQRAGLRIDSDTSARTHWMLQAESNYLEKSNYQYFTRNEGTQLANGAHVLGSVQHEISDKLDLFAQMYYDSAQRNMGNVAIRSDTLDFDMHQRWQFSPQHEFTWGGGYRLILEDSQNSPIFQFTPALRHDKIINAFLQDEITLAPTVKLTLGNKFERNDKSGWENQPNARIIWTVTPQHSLWSAISRAVRTPARYESDLHTIYLATQQVSAALPLPAFVDVGTTDIRPEKLTSYELGWRFQANKQLSIDIATYYNNYKDLIGIYLQNPALNLAIPALVFPGFFSNSANGRVYGAELTADWKANSQLHFQAGYTYSHTMLELFPNSKQINPQSNQLYIQGVNAPHQINIRSQWNFAPQWQWDVNARFVSRTNIPATEDAPASAINAYVALDTRLAWKVRKNLELSLVGRNLLDKQHLEMPSLKASDALYTQVPRSAYMQVRWEFR